MGKTTLAVFFGLVMLVAGASGVYAHQAGGVEIGDWESGSVVGQPFKELDVDAEFYAVEIGTLKAWYPPTTVVDFKVRPGRPLLLKVTNNSTAEHGFLLTDAITQQAPTVLKAQIVLKPGETKFIGIPTSDLFYATTGSTLSYRCHLHPAHVGGQLVMVK
ncbi:MAG TPA: hypothetical protein VFB56_04565 [Nitrospiraceae bacterium]|jgi:hypothetical protein|nr:hypothetical protein [Nitrospiraceae bacterium]